MDLWQKLKRMARVEDAQESNAWYTLMQYRREEIAAEHPVPFCCPFAAGYGCVQARYPYNPAKVPSIEGTPEWRISFERNRFYGDLAAKFCPSCGKGLPGFRPKKQLPPHTPNLKDFGWGSCSKCGERDCFCSSPQSLWEVVGAPPIVAATAFIVNDKREILTVSRKTNAQDKGLPGGRIERRDKTPAHAMIRELKEETGLIAQEYHLIFDAADDLNTRCVTFRVTKYRGKIHTTEKGVVAWSPAQDLVSKKASFHRFNTALFAKVDPYDTLLRAR